MLVGRCLAQDASLDRVDIVQRTTGQQQTISGRVIDYNGRFLILERVGGQQEQIASSRVRKVKTSRTRQHIRADQLLAEHQFEQALTAYQQAVKEETRQWVRQEILAQWVWCYQSLGLVEQAGDAFLKLVLASDPQTLYFQAIPQNCGKQTLSQPQETQPHGCSTGPERAAPPVMAATLLQGTSQRSLAIDVLKQLTTQE
ncbi:MAG: tetratricopeptide repeat protein, partial [Planctomycetaceae bacterium]|nr:tetratricopeptide repeat protein [Planctomycetaceae bacterium]